MKHTCATSTWCHIVRMKCRYVHGRNDTFHEDRPKCPRVIPLFEIMKWLYILTLKKLFKIHVIWQVFCEARSMCSTVNHLYFYLKVCASTKLLPRFSESYNWFIMVINMVNIISFDKAVIGGILISPRTYFFLPQKMKFYISLQAHDSSSYQITTS